MNIIVVKDKNMGISNLQRRTEKIYQRERCDRDSYT